MKVFCFYTTFFRNLFFSFMCCFALLPCYGMEETEDVSSRAFPKMKFKLGFEFQEGSSLCPWALENNKIQKKALFVFKNKEESKKTKEENKPMPLWHVVLDTSDIEFVTRPFTEPLSLETCIVTIIKSFDSLRGLLKGKKKVRFEEWTETITETFKKEPFEITYSEYFDLIKTKPIVRPSEDWKPRFSPQVTIQHPLEYTIPLYFGLFGFKNPSHMMPFVACIPFRDWFLQYHEEANSHNLGLLFGKYGSKISGLVFLHALTLVQMTPDEDATDAGLLKETLTAFTDFQQIDAKMRLTLMSRRPFSSMFRDLNLPNMNYSELFKQAMVAHNQRFSIFYKVPSLFHRTNYAEQFFDVKTGAERPLIHLLPLLQEEFVKTNEEVLPKLLDRGIVSTAMLRNLKEAVKADDFMSFINKPGAYFIKVIDSIASPTERYIMDVDNSRVRKVAFACDNLSPPWFLDLENSMGALKDDLTKEESKYGEAIVEVRGIKHVEDWFLKKIKLDPKIKGAFLTVPEQNLVRETQVLFEFLKEFGTFSDIEDVKLGMTHAIFKN
jgi:hypothetical protein